MRRSLTIAWWLVGMALAAILSATHAFPATPTQDVQLKVSWQDNSNGETQEDHFILERCAGEGCTNFVQVSKFGQNLENGLHVITGDPGNTLYRFRMYAQNSAGRSANSNIAEHRTSPVGDTFLIVDAHTATVTAPMTKLTAGASQGAGYVEIPASATDNFTGSTFGGPGEAKFAINIPVAGTYTLWARVLMPDEGSDSFFIVRDGKTLITDWSTSGGKAPPVSKAWTWHKVTTLTLPIGTLNLAFRQRESGAKLDELFLTTNPNRTPDGRPQAPIGLKGTITAVKHN